MYPTAIVADAEQPLESNPVTVYVLAAVGVKLILSKTPSDHWYPAHTTDLELLATTVGGVKVVIAIVAVDLQLLESVPVTV